jgi:hypothetical protein
MQQLTQSHIHHNCQHIAYSGFLSATNTGLEIAACHLPFFEQNMNMADQD